MKRFLLPLLAAGVCASASALTVDDLVNKRVAVVLQGNDFQLSFPTAGSGAYFTKINNNSLLLNNWYDGIGRQMNLDAKGNLTMELFKGVSGPFNWGNGYPEMYGVTSLCREVQAQYTYDGETAILLCWQYGMLDEQIPSTQHVSLDGGLEGWGFNHRGNAGQGPAILLEWMSKDATLYDIQCFNGFTMYAFPCNANAEEQANGFLADSYPVDLQINKDGSFHVKNFLNQGMKYEVDANSLQYGIGWVEGAIDFTTGEVVIPIQDIAGTTDFGFIGDLSDYDSFLGDGLFFSDGPEGYWFVYLGTMFYPWTIVDASTFDRNGPSAAAISGTYSTGTGKHTGNTRWASNDGDCKTNVNTIIDLGPIGLYASEYGDLIATADNTKITAASEQTTSVDLKIAFARYWDGKATVMGQVTSTANDDKVDHYDVYAVEGRYTSIYDGGFAVDNSIGHRNAVLVYDGSQAQEKDYLFMDGYFTFNGANTGLRDFTFFVKTNYKPETGLEPTFHAMTPFSASNDAAEIELTEGADVTGANGVITIKGTDVEATVYNAAGAVVYQGYDREIPATAGVYVVRLGNTVKKVVL